MPAYIFLMHDDAVADEPDWEPYLRKLQQAGVFEGGSAIGGGVCVRKTGRRERLTPHLAGYIRVIARNLDQAKALLAGIPCSRPAAPSKSASCRGRTNRRAAAVDWGFKANACGVLVLPLPWVLAFGSTLWKPWSLERC
jgi:hypothetical protein